MKDIEIYNWLYDLKPESMEQENKIKAMMRIILLSTDNNIKDFLEILTLDDILDRPTREVYEKYCEWADENHLVKVGHNIFSESVQNKFYVKSKVVRVKNKTLRVYKIM